MNRETEFVLRQYALTCLMGSDIDDDYYAITPARTNYLQDLVIEARRRGLPVVALSCELYKVIANNLVKTVNENEIALETLDTKAMGDLLIKEIVKCEQAVEQVLEFMNGKENRNDPDTKA